MQKNALSEWRGGNILRLCGTSSRATCHFKPCHLPWLAELCSAFRGNHAGSHDALADLESIIDEQYGSLHQQDDVTVVAIRALAPAVAKAA